MLLTQFLSSHAALTPPFMYARYDFLCSNPRCRRLLLHPLVLNCGHAVCADTCSPFHGEGLYKCPRCQAVLTAEVAVCKQVREHVSCMNAWTGALAGENTALQQQSRVPFATCLPVCWQ